MIKIVIPTLKTMLNLTISVNGKLHYNYLTYGLKRD